MKNYSDKILEKIENQVGDWCNDFSETDFFNKLPKSHQDQAWFVTSVFAENMYNYHLQTPKEWTDFALQEVITDLFPRKISADENMFKAVEAVLNAFLQYIGEKKYIKNSSELIEMLKKSAPIMLKKSKNADNWGFAKQFAMSMLQNDIDIQDSAAVNNFMVSYNANIGTISAANSSKVGRNEACPCGSGNKFKKCCGR